MTPPHDTPPLALISDELDVLAALWPTPCGRVIELGCGAARMARTLVERWPALTYLGLEVDARQHAANLAAPPHPRMAFRLEGAQAIGAPDHHFDLALLLKSLHHVPLAQMDAALQEVARVLRPGGFLYVSEPVFEGSLNEIVRLYNDEQAVRRAAQQAVDRATRGPGAPFEQIEERRFDMPVRFQSFEEFERRMLRPTFADHGLTEALVARVAEAFAPHLGEGGAHFTRPMHVRWLRRRPASTSASAPASLNLT